VLATVAVVVAAAALLAPAAVPATNSAASMAALSSGVIRQINLTRAQYGLPPLRLNQKLSEAAASHSQEMADDGYFKHASFDGTPFWQRITQFYGVSGYSYWSVGENLLWAGPKLDAGHAVEWWMESAPHRANILSKDWREVGIGALSVPDAPGTFQGHAVTLVTLDFGVRRPS
jgi:uncharacterized protein YkwD